MPIVARRPWGFIIVLLLIDIGLAIAGVWMLAAGLDDKPSSTPRSGASNRPPPSASK